MKLFEERLKIINVGMREFNESLAAQSIETINVDWRPPCGGDLKLINALKIVRSKNDVDSANKSAAERIINGKIYLAGIGKAIEVIPGMHSGLILHAGPPVEWKNMMPVMREAVICAVICEKLAFNREEAIAFIESGGIEFAPCQDYGAAGQSAGVISASMPVWIVENETFGNKAYATVNEGAKDAIVNGSCSQETIERLCFIRDKFMPAAQKALAGGALAGRALAGRALSQKIDLLKIISSSLHMNDELRLRNKAASALFFSEIAPLIVGTDAPSLSEVLRFFSSNENFFLNLMMAAAKAALDSSIGIDGSTIVTVFSSNGVEVGIKISGAKNRWFTSPAGYINAKYLEGFTEADAARYMGDEAVIDMLSFGGASCASSVLTAKLLNLPENEAVNLFRETQDICETENREFTMSAFGFKPMPAGIDALKIVELGTSPVINAEIKGKAAGMGAIGYGVFRPKVSIFEKIVLKLAESSQQPPAISAQLPEDEMIAVAAGI